MARITVEDCLKKIDSQYDLVLMAKERTTQLNAGDKPLVPEDNDKNTVISLREIGEGKISIKNIEDKDIICLIAGKFHTPEYQLKLIHLAKNLNIEERIHFIGGVSKEELRDLYSNCEIMVFTSPFENFAYTLVEAMSCGSAIIASNTTAMPETCEDAVIYFNPYSAEELTEEINHLLLNTHVIDDYRKKALKRSYEINTYEEANIKTTEIIRNMILNEK